MRKYKVSVAAKAEFAAAATSVAVPSLGVSPA